MLLILIFAGLSSNVMASPIVENTTPKSQSLPTQFCLLPPNLGIQGSMKFLKDCDMVEAFENLPKPAEFTDLYGIHPKICCPPKKISREKICFSSDAWCPTYERKTKTTISPPASPTMASSVCGAANTTCVPVTQCPSLMNSPVTPLIVTPCGFDENAAIMKICCPNNQVEKTVSAVQPPRYPVNDQARPCEDKHSMCPTWADNGACKLDRHHLISDYDNNGFVTSDVMFNFMQTACPQSCGWCQDRGCVDDHSGCIEWAKQGMCFASPFFMGLLCRESCGVCGFLSPDNKENQEVNGKSYSDISKDDFECGKLPDQKLIQKLLETSTTPSSPPSSGVTENNIYCTATVVADKWMVSASHCYDKLERKRNKIKTQIIRDKTKNKEFIEVRRFFKHPFYIYPKLYHDIAVVELGRRIETNGQQHQQTKPDTWETCPS